MNARRGFRLPSMDALEDRVVLSHATVSPHAVAAQAVVSGSTLSQNQAYVQSLFGFVGKTTDPGAVNAYARQLTHGTQTRYHLAQAIVNTPDFRGAETQALFQLLLNRNASASDVAFFGRGGRSNSLVNETTQILSSEEYYQNAGGTNQDFITRIYADVFGRNTDPGARNWVNALDNGASRQQVVSQILNTREGAENLVFLAYNQVLGRNPDAGGSQVYTEYLAKGGTAENVIASLLASQEFFNSTQI